jgi:serine/threonine protein kinase/Tol biopolymer transport system component
MTPDRWQEVDRVWHAVLARPEHDRAAAVAELCAGDEALRREIESLLASLGQASAAGFGAVPASTVPGTSLIGRQLGPYTVRALLGVGGMGEVYRAHDSTLGREVALKTLPDPWLADTDRRLRFEREARLLASLNHTNIAAIYGVCESASSPGTGVGTVRALVLELVEGDTLADLLAAQGSRRRLPLDEVTGIASQIVDALEAAHARGIVHRDLKPANIKVTPEARVKVLDFGLARAVAGDVPVAGLVSSPTVTGHVTCAGVLLGTAPYMSPEQARGHSVDRRADIWAFGCVLYEMLTGTPAFGGHGVADVLAAVLTAEPDWRALPTGTPPAVRLCLRRCLEKNLQQRFHDIGDVRLALAGAFDPPADERPRPTVTPRVAWAGWAVALVALAAVAVLLVSRPREAMNAPETRLEIVTPPTVDPLSIDISPDGRSVVFLGDDAGRQRLLIRRLESSEIQPLQGTDFGTMPFWSPDGRSIGFFGEGRLKRIDLAEGFVRTLASAPHPRRGTWNRDGTIVFGAAAMGPLHSVPAGGGQVTQVTDLLPGQTGHRWPHFLPDGRRFLLMALGTPEVRGLYLGSLDDRTVRKVSDRESAFAFLPPDRMLVGRDGALLVRRLSDRGVEGEPQPVAPKLLIGATVTGHSSLRASAAGHIIYRATAAQTQFVWLDRAGREVSVIGSADDTQPDLDSLSDDGRNLAVQRLVNGNSDVWLIDSERGVPRRLTSHQGFDGTTVFSPDGRRIAYMSDGAADVWDTVYERAADGTGESRLLFKFGVRENHYPEDWSPNDKFLLYSHESAETQFDLWALPLTGSGQPIEVVKTPFFEAEGRFSPDGRWVAYSSDETGAFQIFVRPFPGPGPSRQVSSASGLTPRWRRDGSELFFVERDRLVAIPVTWRGGTLEFGSPRTLFTFPRGWQGSFELSPDGQRFLIPRTVTEASPITVILNWRPPAQ